MIFVNPKSKINMINPANKTKSDFQFQKIDKFFLKTYNMVIAAF